MTTSASNGELERTATPAPADNAGVPPRKKGVLCLPHQRTRNKKTKFYGDHGQRVRICKVCVKLWKRRIGKSKLRYLKLTAKAEGKHLRDFYPSKVYHQEATAECVRHHAERLERTARKRAHRSLAMPAWADVAAIRAIYAEAKRISLATGVKQHVDHIVPLHGGAVCGLHVETNLRIIPHTVNRLKSNKWPEGGEFRK